MPRSETTCSAQSRKHMVQIPCPAAQGAHQLLEAHGQVTWSSHMVYKSAQLSMISKFDISLKKKKTFYFSTLQYKCV